MLKIDKNKLDRRLQLACLSYSTLASETGIAFSTISKIANGERVPRPSTLKKITDVLGCTAADLLADPYAEKKPVTPLKELAEPRVNFRYRLAKYEGPPEDAPIMQLVPTENPIELQGMEPVWFIYCVQYKGSGKYFDNSEDMHKYIESRWGDVGDIESAWIAEPIE